MNHQVQIHVLKIVININSTAKRLGNIYRLIDIKEQFSFFRKLIELCLQKNPTDRPTAKQLLKHDFFKKAKDRPYIAKYLALKFQDRKKMEEKVNRRKPTSVRAVRVSDSGEWKFSSGSDDENTSGNETASQDDSGNKQQPEEQTVKNKGDLQEKSESAVRSIIGRIIDFCYRNIFSFDYHHLQNKSSTEPTTQTNAEEATTGVKELTIDDNQILKFTLRIR